LQRTLNRQVQNFNSSAQIEREATYFRDNIAKSTTAQDLVADRRLLKVALGAFGLEDDLSKKAYILKVLQEGTDSGSAFANRIADKRYRSFASAFGYGNAGGAKVTSSGFSSGIVKDYKERQFEVAVGKADESMRLALSFNREIRSYANSASTDKTVWLQILGNPPLRAVFETAFGLPNTFSQLDIDQQRHVFQDKTAEIFGKTAVAVFRQPENVNKLLQTYFLRDQIAGQLSSASANSTALTILSQAEANVQNLFTSIISIY